MILVFRGVARISSGRAQSRPMTALIEYLTVLLEYFDLFQLNQWGTTHIWVGLCPTRPTLGYASACVMQYIRLLAT